MDHQPSDLATTMERLSDPSPPLPSIPATTNILSLPDDLLLECFRRLSVTYLPSVALVCTCFSDILLGSPDFASLRCRHRLFYDDLDHAITFLSVSSDLTFLSTVNYVPPSFSSSSASFHVSSFRFPSILDAATKISHASTVVIDSIVYLIGSGFTLRIDALAGIIKPCAPTIVLRRRFAAVTFGGKIYVAGGAYQSRSVEEYDPSSDKWQVVARAPVDLSRCFLGVIIDEHLCFFIDGGIPSTVIAYDFSIKRWCKKPLRGLKELCPSAHAVGVCEAGGHVFLLMRSGEYVWFVGPPPTRLGCQLYKEYRWTTEKCRENNLVRIGCIAIGVDKLGVMIEASSESAKTEIIFIVFDLNIFEWIHIPELVSPFDGTVFTGICSSDNACWFDDKFKYF